MGNVLVRACPRCAGDVRVYRDLDGPHASCIQCGRELAPATVAARPGRKAA